MTDVKPLGIDQRATLIMNRNNFTWMQQRAAKIWAARSQECPKCKAEAWHACLNMADTNRGATMVRLNKTPHEERIDYPRLIAALNDRGYL